MIMCRFKKIMEFDKNYLDHDFIKWIVKSWFICKKCKVLIFDYERNIDRYKFYINNVRYENQFSCNEVIIKNLIE